MNLYAFPPVSLLGKVLKQNLEPQLPETNLDSSGLAQHAFILGPSDAIIRWSESNQAYFKSLTIKLIADLISSSFPRLEDAAQYH